MMFRLRMIVRTANIMHPKTTVATVWTIPRVDIDAGRLLECR